MTFVLPTRKNGEVEVAQYIARKAKYFQLVLYNLLFAQFKIYIFIEGLSYIWLKSNTSKDSEYFLK